MKVGPKAKLNGADLCGANLEEASLQEANLKSAGLRGANLWRANLQGADLRWADLQEANLQGANLEGADLQEANLEGANLEGANLQKASIRNTNFQSANLQNTCLDPMANVNPPSRGVFIEERTRSGMVWYHGFRTKNSPYTLMGFQYKVGEIYTDPVFSVASFACHPGFYVSPTISIEYFGPYIEVIFRDFDCHQAEGKYRVREFLVIDVGYKEL